MDLHEPGQVYSDNIYKYVIVVIDVVTRYIFTRALKSKKCKKANDPVPQALKSILSEIHQLKVKSSINSQNFLLFYSDLGKEFDNKLMGRLMKKYNAGLLTLGDDFKAGMSERAIRSIESISANMSSQSTKFDFFKELKTITLNYNFKSHSSLPQKMSPHQYLNYLGKNESKLPLPWNVVNVTDNDNISNIFNFDQNYKTIEKKINLLKKKIPILSVVKLATSKRQFAKGELSEKWTVENFYVTGYKRPFVSTEPVLIKVSDSAGVELKGVFRENELKIVPRKGVLTVSNFIDKVKKKGSKELYYIVTIATFGKTVFFELTNKELARFNVTQSAQEAKITLDKE